MPQVVNCKVTIIDARTGAALGTNVDGNLYPAGDTVALPVILSGARGELDLTNPYTLLIDSLKTMPKDGDKVVIVSSSAYSQMAGLDWTIYKPPQQWPALGAIKAATQIEIARRK